MSSELKMPKKITLFHHISFVYISYAHITDNNLSEIEQEEILKSISVWGCTEEETISIVTETVEWYSSMLANGIPIDKMIDLCFEVFNEKLNDQMQQMLLVQLSNIAKADGEILENEAKLLVMYANRLSTNTTSNKEVKPKKNKKYNLEKLLSTQSSIDNLCKQIDTNKILPFLPFVSKVLSNKGYEVDKHTPFYFNPSVNLGNGMSGFLYVNMDGFYSNCVEPNQMIQIFSWGILTDLKFTTNESSTTITLVTTEGCLDIEDTKGNSLRIVKSIYTSYWKDVIEKFKDSPMLIWNEIDEMGVQQKSFKSKLELNDYCKSSIKEKIEPEKKQTPKAIQEEPNPDKIATLFIQLVAADNPDIKKIMDLLMFEDFDYDMQNSKGLSALHYAAWDNKYDIAKELIIEWNAKVNTCSLVNETPLHLAITGGSNKLVKLLLDAGADMEIREREPNPYTSKKGSTPLFLAVLNQKWDMVDLLIEKGANINVLKEPCEVGMNGETEFFKVLEILYSSMNESFNLKRHLALKNQILGKETKKTATKFVNKPTKKTGKPSKAIKKDMQGFAALFNAEKDVNALNSIFEKSHKLWRDNLNKISEVKYIMFCEAPPFDSEGAISNYIYDTKGEARGMYLKAPYKALKGEVDSYPSKEEMIDFLNEQGFLFLDVVPLSINFSPKRNTKKYKDFVKYFWNGAGTDLGFDEYTVQNRITEMKDKLSQDLRVCFSLKSISMVVNSLENPNLKVGAKTIKISENLVGLNTAGQPSVTEITKAFTHKVLK